MSKNNYIATSKKCLWSTNKWKTDWNSVSNEGDGAGKPPFRHCHIHWWIRKTGNKRVVRNRMLMWPDINSPRTVLYCKGGNSIDCKGGNRNFTLQNLVGTAWSQSSELTLPLPWQEDIMCLLLLCTEKDARFARLIPARNAWPQPNQEERADKSKQRKISTKQLI